MQKPLKCARFIWFVSGKHKIRINCQWKKWRFIPRKLTKIKKQRKNIIHIYVTNKMLSLRNIPQHGASCISLKLDEGNMCDVCANIYSQITQDQTPRTKKECLIPWRLEPNKKHMTTTVLKHKSTVANLKALGYKAEESGKYNIKCLLKKNLFYNYMLAHQQQRKFYLTWWQVVTQMIAQWALTRATPTLVWAAMMIVTWCTWTKQRLRPKRPWWWNLPWGRLRKRVSAFLILIHLTMKLGQEHSNQPPLTASLTTKEVFCLQQQKNILPRTEGPSNLSLKNIMLWVGHGTRSIKTKHVSSKNWKKISHASDTMAHEKDDDCLVLQVQ